MKRRASVEEKSTIDLSGPAESCVRAADRKRDEKGARDLYHNPMFGVSFRTEGDVYVGRLEN